jgi:hypothetical protein
VSRSNAELGRLAAEGRPLAVVFFRYLDERESLAGLLELLLPEGASMQRVDELAAVFDPATFDQTLAVFFPDATSEEEAVGELERRRDALVARRATAVLFFPVGGAAARRLHETPSLASWLRGQMYTSGLDELDPDTGGDEDFDRARAAFEARTRQTPEAWWEAWSRGAIESTLVHHLLAVEAERLCIEPLS